MNADGAKKLREPFPAGMVGKLPRVTCKNCSDARDKHCDKHQKTKCAECGNFITTAHIHLDYIGHAAVTDRLLQADNSWTWVFQAVNADGSPVVFTSGLADPFAKVGIWINLTVCSVTRPGFGEGKNFKEAIGDALRNAAMRFGVALDLWAKEDLHADDAPDKPAAAKTDAPIPASAPQLAEYRALAEAWGLIHPDFDVPAALTLAEGKDAGWVERATAKLKANIEERAAKDAAPENKTGFEIPLSPADRKKAAA